MGTCVPRSRPLTARRLFSLILLAVWPVGCGGDGPTTPTSLLGPHKVVYLIYLTDSAEVAFRQAEYPSGVFGVSPESAARRFDAPLDGPAPGRGIRIDWQGHAFDPTVSHGALDPSGLQYEWVGYFYVRSK